MKAAERIRKGFGRIAYFGGSIGLLLAALNALDWTYTVAFKRTANVYFEGRYVDVPKSATVDDLVQLLRQNEAKWDYWEEVLHPSRKEPIETRATLLRERSASFFEAPSAKYLIGFCLAGALAWTATWLVASWIIRGFLE